MIFALACLIALQSDDFAHKIGGDVTAPSVVNRPEPENPSRANGSVVLSMEVTKDGRPEKMLVTRSLEPVADQAAVDAIRQWTFRPGKKYGNPVRVIATVEVIFHAGKTTAPKVVKRVEPAATNPAISGKVVLSVHVSEEGKVEEIRVLNGIDPVLDQSAVDAVKNWKFKPGTKDGTPVRVATAVEVNFPWKR